MTDHLNQPGADATLACAVCGAAASWQWIDGSFRAPADPCSQCGKGPSYIGHIKLTDTIPPQYDSVRAIVIPEGKGKRHWILDTFTGHQFSHRLGRFVEKFWRRERKPGDVYEERVVDPETGEVIHECKEKLSEHRGHGSAKQRPDDAEQHAAPASLPPRLRRSGRDAGER